MLTRSSALRYLLSAKKSTKLSMLPLLTLSCLASFSVSSHSLAPLISDCHFSSLCLCFSVSVSVSVSPLPQLSLYLCLIVSLSLSLSLPLPPHLCMCVTISFSLSLSLLLCLCLSLCFPSLLHEGMGRLDFLIDMVNHSSPFHLCADGTNRVSGFLHMFYHADPCSKPLFWPQKHLLKKNSFGLLSGFESLSRRIVSQYPTFYCITYSD